MKKIVLGASAFALLFTACVNLPQPQPNASSKSSKRTKADNCKVDKYAPDAYIKCKYGYGSNEDLDLNELMDKYDDKKGKK